MAEDLQSKFNEVFTSFREDLYNAVIESIRKKGHTGENATDPAILDTIGFKLISKKGVLGFDLEMADYWEYLENGRKPTSWRFKRGNGGKQSPFISSIMQWIEWKGLEVQTVKGQSYDKALKSFAFAIANKINKVGTIKGYGYKGSHFLSDVLNDGRLDTFASDLTDLLGEEVVIVVTDKLEA